MQCLLRLLAFTWLSCTVAALAAEPNAASQGGGSGQRPGSAGRPNILFIYADDQSYRTLSCYPEAYEYVKTPHLDRLAQSGIRFTHAYIGTWCMPSRATMLTGLHPYGVQTMRMEGEYPGSTYDPAQCRFWPAVFRQHGYHTAQIGKWHTGTDTGFGRDWDYQVVWNRPRYPANSGNYFYDQIIETNGGEGQLVKGYSTDNYTQWAEEYIRGKHRDAEKPWYLWLCYGAVHGPFTPADRHLQTYPGAKIENPRDIFPPRPGKPKYVRDIDNWDKLPDGQAALKGGKFETLSVETKPGIHGNTLSDWIRQYNQGVLAIDDGVGKLIAALKETGQLENTLVVYTADQGFGWGDHGFHHKLAPYDSTIRSPLIMSRPGTIAGGQVCGHAVGGADLPPTFFRVAELDLPWEMHGHDLTPLLQNPAAAWPHPVLTTLTARKYGADCDRVPTDPETLYQGAIPWWVSLRQGKYKYIRTLVEGEIEELYDLEQDPGELDNLALKPEHARPLREFREATVAELKRTGAKMAGYLPKVGTP